MNLKIGVVTSRFNEDITTKLEEGAIETLENFEEAEIEVWAVRVPGAVEIPLACKMLFDQGCDGVVALGAVIRGETSHYDVVCSSVERGVTQLMLETGKPIGFGVITTENEEQAYDRVGGKHGHKGAEAAQVTLEMIGLGISLKNSGISQGLPKAKAKSAAKSAKKAAKKPGKGTSKKKSK